MKITLSLPACELHPNSRCHWAVKARATKAARNESRIKTMMVMQRSGVVGRWPQVMIRPLFFVPDSRRRDPDNMLASLKAYIDGLVDAKLITDDRYVNYLSVVVEVDRKNPRVELEVS